MIAGIRASPGPPWSIPIPTCNMLWQRRSASVGSATPRSELAGPLRRAEGFEHRGDDGRRWPRRRSHQLFARVRPALVQRQQQRPTVPSRARGDRGRELDHHGTASRGRRTAKRSRRPRRKVVDLVLVPRRPVRRRSRPSTRSGDRGSRQYPAGVGDVLERGPHARPGEDRGRGFEDLHAARTVGRFDGESRVRHVTAPRNRRPENSALVRYGIGQSILTALTFVLGRQPRACGASFTALTSSSVASPMTITLETNLRSRRVVLAFRTMKSSSPSQSATLAA